MKNIYLILALFFCYTSSAQDPRLFENTWYFRIMLIQEDMYVGPTSNDEVPYVSLKFYENDGILETTVCNLESARVEFDGRSFYFPEGMSLTLDDCEIPANNMFEEFYFDYIFYAGYPLPPGLIVYEIIDEGDGDLTLIVITPDCEAIYGNYILNINDFKESHFAIYPNPASEQLTLTSKGANENIKIQIFNIEGRLLSNHNLNSRNSYTLDVSQLSSGMYFMNIKDEDGNMEVKRLIKD